MVEHFAPRRSLSRLLSLATVPDAGTTGVVPGTRDAVRLMALDEATVVDPVDIVLVDGYAAARSSLSAAKRLTGDPSVRAVALHALHITPDLVEAARRSHVAGLIGRQVFGPALVDSLIAIAGGDELGRPMVLKSPEHALSAQERDILLLIGQGCSNDDISRELGLPLNTVKSAARTVYRKLGVRNRIGAAMVAHRHAHATVDRPIVPSSI